MVFDVTRLPNTRDAVLDICKLKKYCLDDRHPRGRHKARVFRSALGLTASDSVWLREVILASILRLPATALASDEFGTRYRVDVPVERQEGEGVVRTMWIVAGAEGVPRFVTCWVL
jgi:hypothetical protein